eukprot:1214271-Pleurochrysis_carterae.AAC.2
MLDAHLARRRGSECDAVSAEPDARARHCARRGSRPPVPTPASLCPTRRQKPCAPRFPAPSPAHSTALSAAPLLRPSTSASDLTLQLPAAEAAGAIDTGASAQTHGNSGQKDCMTKSKE